MQHVDPDRLALLALGERLSGDDEDELTSHLAGCLICQQEVRSLRHTAQLAREAVSARDAEDSLRPGESVWTGIVAELGLHGPGPVPLSGQPEPPRPDRRPGRPDPGGWGDAGGAGPARSWEWFQPGSSGPGTPPPWPAAEIRPAGSPRHAATGPATGSAPPARRRWARTAVALAAAAAIGVLGTLGAVRPWQERGAAPPPAASPTATLAPVPGGPGGVSGRALVVRGGSGLQLRVDTAGLPPLNQGYYEVWVFDGRTNMVAVGVLGPGPTASLPLPPTLDLRTFAIVDISQEKYDGNQTHSETSVLRGTLTG